MPRRRIVVGVVALLLGMTFTATVAHAGQGAVPVAAADPSPSPSVNPSPLYWPFPVVCSEARFTGHHGTLGPHGISVTLSGWIHPCRGVNEPKAHRSFTWYGPGPGKVSVWIAPMKNRGSYTFNVNGLVPANTRANVPTSSAASFRMRLVSPRAGCRACSAAPRVCTPCPRRCTCCRRLPSSRPHA